MSGTLSLFDTALVLGFCFSGVAIALVFSLRFLNYPDLTVEGSFPLGAAAGALCLIHTGSVWLAFIAAVAAGLLAGCVTAAMHVFLGVGKLLSGILMLAMLYSICLRILGGSNLSLLSAENWFTRLELVDRGFGGLGGVRIDPAKLTFFGVLAILICCGAVFFFGSRTGIAIRSLGDNERVLVNLGRDPRPYKFLALALANGLAACSGLCVALNQGFADVGMGQGTLVLGLAGLIVGEQTIGRLLGERRLVVALVLAALVGSILYQIALLLALRLGIAPSDLKLFTALIVLSAVVVTRGGSVFYPGRTF